MKKGASADEKYGKFEVTFENGKREQISEGCVCRIKNDGNVIFEGSGVEMSEKTV